MNSSRRIRRAQQRDEMRKKRKNAKADSQPSSQPKILRSTMEPGARSKQRLKINPRTLSLSYFLCMTANIVTILSTMVFPIRQGKILNIQNLFQTNSTLSSIGFQLATLILVNLMLYRILIQFERKAQAKTLITTGALAVGILVIQIAFKLSL